MNRRHLLNFLKGVLIALPLCNPAFADSRTSQATYEACLTRLLQSALDTDTVGDIRRACADINQKEGVVDVPEVDDTQLPDRLLEARLAYESAASRNRFAIVQHKGNYVFPLTYNSKVNNAPFQEVDENAELQRAEFKFQLSMKLSITDDLFNTGGRLFAGYTNQSYWQVYDTENSSPFRETIHEPELFVDYDTDINLGSWSMPLIRLGLVHQSNGRSAPLSRGWNRVYGQFFLEKRNWAVSFKPWIRIPEPESRDDNPDIEDFLGNFELGILRKGNRSTASIMLRNNLQSPNRSGIQLDYTLPIPGSDNLRFYLQYFYGYGESLIDYDAVSNRFSIGLKLNDLL